MSQTTMFEADAPDYRVAPGRRRRPFESGGHELRQELMRLGWSQATLAERLTVNPRTVGRWVQGSSEVPGPVRAYIRLAVRVRALL